VEAEDNGMPIVLHVHDEPVAEVPDTPEFKLDTLIGIMTKGPAWAAGLPLSAEGFESRRYEK
jgi:DNA polymerase